MNENPISFANNFYKKLRIINFNGQWEYSGKQHISYLFFNLAIFKLIQKKLYIFFYLQFIACKIKSFLTFISLFKIE